MSKGKLAKFADMAAFPHVFEYPYSVVDNVPFEMRGRWGEEFFHNDRPIVLELGCGRGEYTVGLGRLFPEKNFIGVDIKGARMWSGAKESLEAGMTNVAFLRTNIEIIDRFFSPGEVSEIWLTFSDPQLKSEGQRLTSPQFLERYRKFLRPGVVVHLKTDSQFLYRYSLALAQENGLEILASTADLYAGGTRETLSSAALASVCGPDSVDALFEVQTYYERMFLGMGLPITYLSFRIDHEGAFVSPQSFDTDYWRAAEGTRRSFGHGMQK